MQRRRALQPSVMGARFQSPLTERRSGKHNAFALPSTSAPDAAPSLGRLAPMLFRPEAFEPLTERPWDEGDVRRAIHAIVADVDAAFDAGRLWPADDDWDAWKTPTPLKTLYVGAA